MSRLLALLTAIEGALKAPPSPFRSVAIQLDAVDVEDIVRQSFGAPAARVLFVRGTPIRNPDRSLDLDCGLAVAVLAEATPPLSADAAALERAIDAFELVDENRWGLTDIGMPRELAMRVAVTAGAETKGMSITLVGWQQRLLRVTAGEPNALGVIGDDGLALPPEMVWPPEHLEEELADVLPSGGPP